MKNIGIKTLLIIFFFTTLSCEKDDDNEMENVLNTTSIETEIISGDYKSTIKTQEEMEKELYSYRKKYQIGKNSEPPHFAFNSGTLYQSFGSNDDFWDFLEFGNRVDRFAATQWVDYDINLSLMTQQVGSPGGIYGTVPKSGWLQFRLDGVGQSVYLNYRLNSTNTNVQLTVGTTANFHEHIIQPSPIWIAGAGPTHVTIHTNTNGWMWVQIKQNNFIKFSAHYRFDTSSVHPSASDGYIIQGGFGQNRDSYSYPTYNYTGYSGWF